MTETLDVVLNGKTVTLRKGTVVAEAIGALGLTDRILIAELNGEPLVRSAWAAQELCADDRLEVVRVVAGG